MLFCYSLVCHHSTILCIHHIYANPFFLEVAMRCPFYQSTPFIHIHLILATKPSRSLCNCHPLHIIHITSKRLPVHVYNSRPLSLSQFVIRKPYLAYFRQYILPTLSFALFLFSVSPRQFFIAFASKSQYLDLYGIASN